MYIFIDESGDTGFKFNKGSSRFFVVTMVIFKDSLDAEETSLDIKKLKRRLRLPDFAEFKFSKTSNKYRKEFFESIRSKPFFFKALAINKKHTLSKTPEFKKKFYHSSIKLLFELEKDFIEEAVIFIDKKASRSFAQAFNTFLRKQLKIEDKKLFKKIKHRSSHSNILLQLTDMISGAIFRKLEKEDPKFYNLIKKQESKIHLFPE